MRLGASRRGRRPGRSACCGVEAGLVAAPAAPASACERSCEWPAEVVDQPLRRAPGPATCPGRAAAPSGPGPAAGTARPSRAGVRSRRRGAEQPAHQLLADVLERPDALLLAAAEQRVDDLEQQVFEELGVLLVDAGRDEQLPRPAAAVLDRVQQVRLAGALVAEDRHDLGVRRRVVAVQVDDAEEQVALGGEQLGDVVAGADLVVRVAGEVVAERVAGPLAARRGRGR